MLAILIRHLRGLYYEESLSATLLHYNGQLYYYSIIVINITTLPLSASFRSTMLRHTFVSYTASVINGLQRRLLEVEIIMAVAVGAAVAVAEVVLVVALTYHYYYC